MDFKKKVILVIAISFIVLGTSLYIANTFTTSSTSDVLIVQVGDDDNLEKTTQLISNNLQNRNEYAKKIDKDEENIKYKPNQLDLIYPTSEINLGALNFISEKSFILDVDVLKISVEDLNNGALDKYNTKVLVLVGHGNKNGLEDKTNEMDWGVLENLLDKNSADLFILASCYSAKATKDLPNAFGFPDVIDGIIAANIASALIFKALDEPLFAKEVMNMALNRFEDIYNNPELLMPLELDAYEIIYWIMMSIFAVINIILTFYLPDMSLFEQIAVQFFMYGVWQIVTSLMFFAIGTIDIWSLIGTLFCFTLDCISALINAIYALFASNYWYALFLVSYFVVWAVATIAALYYTGSGYLWIKVVIAICSIISIGLGIYQDWLD